MSWTPPGLSPWPGSASSASCRTSSLVGSGSTTGSNGICVAEQDLYPETTEIWQRFDATNRPDDIAPPILAIHDRDDAAAPIDQAYLLKAAYGDQVRLITTNGLGHSKILADPTVIDAALDFLGVPAESGGTQVSQPDMQLQPA